MPWQRDEGQGTRHTRDDGNQGGGGGGGGGNASWSSEHDSSKICSTWAGTTQTSVYTEATAGAVLEAGA